MNQGYQQYLKQLGISSVSRSMISAQQVISPFVVSQGFEASLVLSTNNYFILI